MAETQVTSAKPGYVVIPPYWKIRVINLCSDSIHLITGCYMIEITGFNNSLQWVQVENYYLVVTILKAGNQSNL